MARNLKKDYILKLIKTDTQNGYKFDLANYLYNPSYDYEYPSFTKVISEDEETKTVRDVLYFKHYDGTGEYLSKIKTFRKADEEGGWAIATKVSSEILEVSNRFNLKTLISYC